MRYTLLVISLFVVAACSGTGPVADFDPSAPKAHHTDDGFRNLYIDDEDKPGFFSFLFKVRLQENWPDEDALVENSPTPTVEVDLDKIRNPNPKKLQVTWIGHSTFLLQKNGVNILTDPIFSNRASPFASLGPRRYSEPAIALEDLPDIDAVIISHNHYDHMDEATIEALGNTPRWYVPLKNGGLFREAGITNLKELDWWEEETYEGTVYTLTPSQHWSGRGLFDRYKALWGGWAVQFSGDTDRIWFGGDTGYNDIQFKEIGERLGPFNLSLIPVGAYDPRWFMKDAHANPEEAVQIHLDVKSQKSIGMHWGTFILTSEPVMEPPERLKKAVKEAGLPAESFITLPVGGMRQVDPLKRGKPALAKKQCRKTGAIC
ncbi:MBL fold metallo-hydrolase [Sneathiella sp. P13V-1]|uniref:MBL fold metallo-hydrolase n=1 Tax=Sneathiella sp. P13V-1 TaxID=2697366 RepID=UPI00187B2EE1|nr:MBL fold metallo-hydrolase [Sneathiella sp. P13V-1]MBE7635904.1 MBL fold metallo-hydrolase [Sneathiella sp. P13V-1]